MTAYGEFSGGKLIFYFSGELDESNIRVAAAELDGKIAENPTAVILDFSELSFIDSTGIGMLLARYGRLKKAGIPLYARGLKGQTEKVFRMSGLLGIINVLR
ncbi:MAG: STAS domain-containing protein [Clostridiales bacterium]|jgi:stage II sporulation protein AA (anti-sigma F factor antagonist)|nr:STAS domain-containing protein [Clostridiales bacterium]